MKPLPPLEINLPHWEEHQFQHIRKAEQKLTSVKRKAGIGSDEFKNACRRLLEVVLGGQGQTLPDQIKSAIDVRAFTFLLSSSDEFANKVKLSRVLLDHLLSVRSPLSRLTLTQLIRAFLVRFDQVADNTAIEDWSEFIKYQLGQIDSGRGSSELKSQAKYKDIIFSPYGPSRAVKFARREEIDFDGMLVRFALTGFADGRFLTLCRYQYYLETLKSLPVGEEHPVLAEICKPEVANSPYTPDKQLGHVLLEVLIDRSEGTPISQSWQSTVLTIAGDPRVPKSSPNYQQWWALLGEKRISLMRGWLSRFDLTLFLKVLEQSAKDGRNSDMERMFESRKVFMEGLLKLGLVVESRLFLSGDAESYLRRHFDRKELPEYARVSSQQTSMIYLNLSGKVHMLEGSHSFKLKLFDRLPASAQLSDYGIKVVGDSDLRSSIVYQYGYEFGDSDGYRDLTHDVHLNWQHKAISFLNKNGVSVEPGELISQNRYREYKYKFGVN